MEIVGAILVYLAIGAVSTGFFKLVEDWFIDIDRRRKNHLWALATDKQMRALLKGARVFMLA